MLKKFIIFLIMLLVTIKVGYAEKRLDIDIKITSYEISDAYVVGDAFYYVINFTNSGDERIEDKITIRVFNPKDEEIEKPREYDITLIVNESKTIKALGGKENETAVFPFDTSGSYKTVITSDNPIDFYRWFIVGQEKIDLPDKIIIKTYRNYIRINKEFKFDFDVMPKWQYELWKESQKSNQKIQEANQKLIDLTDNINTATQQMNSATQNVKFATWAMLIVAILTLIVALRRREAG